MKALKFIFLRLSAFMFDMLALSFIVAMFLTVSLDILGIQSDAINVIYHLNTNSSVFKSIFYLALIGFYYGVHVFFRKATIGLWITHQDFAEKLPSISKAASEDEELVQDIVKKRITIHKRLFNAFLYSSFQMINVAFLGAMTLFAAFSPSQVAYHESMSGVRIISRNAKG